MLIIKKFLHLFFQKGPVCNMQQNEITFFIYLQCMLINSPFHSICTLKQGREEVNVSRLFKWNKKKVKSFENDESSFFLWQMNSMSKRRHVALKSENMCNLCKLGEVVLMTIFSRIVFAKFIKLVLDCLQCKSSFGESI